MKIKRFILLFATLACIMIIALAGCGGTSDTPPQVTPDDPAPVDTVPDETEAPDDNVPDETELTPGDAETGLRDDFIIGWQPNTLTPPWRERMMAAELRLAQVNEELGTNGTFLVKTTELHGNIIEQSVLFDDFIASGADIIIGIAADPESYAGLAARATEAGIPVGVMVETADIPNVRFRVTQDEEEAGEMLGQRVAADLDGEGNVVLLRGQMEHSVDIGRTTGILRAFENYPGITIIAEQEAGWAHEPAARIMDDLIIAHGDDINAVVALNDNMALGSIASARAAGRSFLTYGMDGTVEGIQAILAGDLVASMDSDFTIFGKYLIDSAIDYLQHGTTRMDWLIPNGVIDSTNAQEAMERYERTVAGEITW